MSAQLVARGAGLGQGRFSTIELLTDLRQFVLQPVDARSTLIGLLSDRSPGLLQVLLWLGGRGTFAIDVNNALPGGLSLLGELPLEAPLLLKRPLKFAPLLRCLFDRAARTLCSRASFCSNCCTRAWPKGPATPCGQHEPALGWEG